MAPVDSLGVISARAVPHHRLKDRLRASAALVHPYLRGEVLHVQKVVPLLLVAAPQAVVLNPLNGRQLQISSVFRSHLNEKCFPGCIVKANKVQNVGFAT